MKYWADLATGHVLESSLATGDATGAFIALGQNLLNAAEPGTHPAWQFDWTACESLDVLWCALALGLSAVLSAAAGIGGGGIYVCLLMVLSNLSPREAVPLSKAVVFFGSVSSLLLNVQRALLYSRADGGVQESKAVVDGTACLLVVPMAIFGTYLGVLTNRTASDLGILAMLNSLLVVLALTVVRQGVQQRAEEDQRNVTDDTPTTDAAPAGMNPQDGPEEEIYGFLLGGTGLDVPAPGGQHRESHFVDAPVQVSGRKGAYCLECFFVPATKSSGLRLPTALHFSAAISLTVCVVLAGAFGYHYEQCVADLRGGGLEQPHCQHPMARYLRTYEDAAAHEDSSETMSVLKVLTLPLWFCFFASVATGVKAYTEDQWTAPAILLYQVISLLTGLLAGLVGVGGGLILAPFFVLTGMDSAVAVGTSATCVLFTSASTTFQYMLTDRIIMSLAVVYGAVVAVFSLLGTRLVHHIQDQGSRKSNITFIVAGGVSISLLLSMLKLGYMMHTAPA